MYLFKTTNGIRSSPPSSVISPLTNLVRRLQRRLDYRVVQMIVHFVQEWVKVNLGSNKQKMRKSGCDSLQSGDSWESRMKKERLFLWTFSTNRRLTLTSPCSCPAWQVTHWCLKQLELLPAMIRIKPHLKLVSILCRGLWPFLHESRRHASGPALPSRSNAISVPEQCGLVW